MAQKYLRCADVQELTGLGRSTIYKLMDEADFPRPVKVTGKTVRWPEKAVEEWLASRPLAA